MSYQQKIEEDTFFIGASCIYADYWERKNIKRTYHSSPDIWVHYFSPWFVQVFFLLVAYQLFCTIF